MWVEAVVQAFKLFVLTVGYALEEARKHEQAVADANARRSLFEVAVLRAMADLGLRATQEKRQGDAVDDAVDNKN